MRIFPLLLLALLFAIPNGISQVAPAPVAPASPAVKLRAVTRNVEPFSFEKDGRRVGYSVELWEALARETGMQFEMSTVNSAKDMIAALENKTADVAVGALSITSQREAICDFTQPFYDSGLQILVTVKSESTLGSAWQLISNLFNWKLVGVFLLLIVAMLIISHLVWMYEHPVNGDMWPQSYRHGLWESFWWTICTLLVGGADNKGPVGVGGRIVAIVWMLLSIVLVSFLTASFTTTMTVNSLKGDINGPGDLPGHTVATIAGSTSETWLTSRNRDNTIKVRTYKVIAECVTALKKGEVKAVVFDAPILSYTMQQSGDSDLKLAGPMFERQNYGFAVQQDSPLREQLNRALLALNERGLIEELRTKWFGAVAE
ncbi:MAG TPA: transporter substrate-binding domain-containing protein [Chthoniobacterales bacterium]|jgi:ABC-type amino acid transport substrate-binding protein